MLSVREGLGLLDRTFPIPLYSQYVTADRPETAAFTTSPAKSTNDSNRVVFARGTGGHVLVTEFRGMTPNGLFCADVLRPLDLVHLTDFTYKYHPGLQYHPNPHYLPHWYPNLFLSH